MDEFEKDVMNAELVEEEAKENSPVEKLKRTAKEAANRSIEAANNGLRWALDHPKETIGIIGAGIIGYSRYVRPMIQDARDFKEAHTYKFYDYRNHRTCYLRRPLTDDEHEALCDYIDDRSQGKRYASEWLRTRRLLKK